ncbi:MAG: helix-turn-helix domain-containing protein [Vicinamibacterales bacterium]
MAHVLHLFAHTLMPLDDHNRTHEGSLPSMDREWARVVYVRRLIEERFDQPLTLDTLAAAVGLHRASLASAFRRRTGQTVHQTLIGARMRRAEELVREGCKIEAVVLLVGYRSKKSFYRHFRSRVGVTPGTYRLQFGALATVAHDSSVG